MKRSCDRCKALSLSADSIPMCKLGYQIDSKTYLPKEDCPKPLTYLAFIELSNDRLQTLREKE